MCTTCPTSTSQTAARRRRASLFVLLPVPLRQGMCLTPRLTPPCATPSAATSGRRCPSHRQGPRHRPRTALLYAAPPVPCLPCQPLTPVPSIAAAAQGAAVGLRLRALMAVCVRLVLGVPVHVSAQPRGGTVSAGSGYTRPRGLGAPPASAGRSPPLQPSPPPPRPQVRSAPADPVLERRSPSL